MAKCAESLEKPKQMPAGQRGAVSRACYVVTRPMKTPDVCPSLLPHLPIAAWGQNSGLPERRPSEIDGRFLGRV